MVKAPERLYPRVECPKCGKRYWQGRIACPVNYCRKFRTSQNRGTWRKRRHTCRGCNTRFFTIEFTPGE